MLRGQNMHDLVVPRNKIVQSNSYEVEIFGMYLDSRLMRQWFEACCQRISLNRLLRVRKFLKQEDAYRSVMGELLVRSILNDKYGLPNKEIIFSTTTTGKPILAGRVSQAFSISHSGMWVLCAISDRPVGVDLEKIVERNVDFAKQYFAPHEIDTLFSLTVSDQLNCFYTLWTAKESFLKAKGTGLSGLHSGLDVMSCLNGGIVCIQDEEENWYTCPFEVDPNYKAAVCIKGMQSSISTHIISTQGLKHIIEQLDPLPHIL